MAVKKHHKALIKKLKKQVRALHRKSDQNRNKLRGALKKMRKQGRAYKSKLVAKVRTMKAKIADAKSSGYGKAAAGLEKQLKKDLQSKAKAFAAAVVRVEKKHAAKLAKSIAKKGKVRRSKKTDPKKMVRMKGRRSARKARRR